MRHCLEGIGILRTECQSSGRGLAGLGECLLLGQFSLVTEAGPDTAQVSEHGPAARKLWLPSHSFVQTSQMEWLPPSLDGIAMCQGRGFQRHAQRRTAR